MNIIFKKIRTHNYLSYKDVEFDFSTFDSKTILISGENRDVAGDGNRNGAGKSTLFSALVFAIYGEPINTMKGTHISNWNAKPSEDVCVTLEVDNDSKKYIISRSLIGKKKGQELHVYDVTNEDAPAEEITRSTIAETQRMIETDIVPCGKDGFVRCIYLTADQNYNFFKLSKSAKNEFFESLFELTAYSNMYTILHRKTLDESNSQIATSRTIDQLTQNIEKLKRERDEAEKNQDGVKRAEQSIVDANSALRDFIARKNLTVNDDYSIVFNVDESYNNIVTEGKALSERSKNGKAEIEKIDTEIRKLETMLHTIDADINTLKNNILAANKGIAYKKSMIEKHSNITNILCDDCLPKFRTEMNFDEIETSIQTDYSEIERMEREINEYLAKKPKISEAITLKTNIKCKYTQAVESFDKRIMELRTLIATTKERQSALQMELNTYVTAVSNAKDAYEQMVKCATNSFNQPIAVLEASLVDARKQYAEHNSNVAHYKALESILKPENIRKSVVSDMLKELNFRISGYLSKMGYNYSCTFDENFEASFASSTGKSAEYNNFSSGERMRLGIACCLAFKDFMQVRLNIHSNILAIDEYIDSNLDPLAVNGIMDLIRYMVANEQLSAFIISHRSEVINSLTDGEIRVIKENDESKLEINVNTIS